MGKRILSLLLSIIMILSLAPVTFAESSNVTASTAATTVNAGESFTVTLSNQAMTVSTFTAGLRFDKTKLEVISIVGNIEGYPDWIGLEKTSGPVSQVEFSTKSTVAEANTNGTVGVGLTYQEDNAYKATTIYTVTFKVKEGVWGTVVVTAYEDSSGANGYKADSNTVTVNVPCKHDDTVTTIPAVEPTCSKFGNKAYYQCDICEAYFTTYSDNKLSGPINDLNTWLVDGSETGGKINKTGHTWSNTLSYDADGHYYECSVCGSAIIDAAKENIGNKTSHTLDAYEVGTADNGIGVGYHALKCSCGYVDVAGKVEHSYTEFDTADKDTHTFKCVCGATESGAHDPANDWINGGTTHWHACGGCTYHCGEVPHIYNQEKVDNDYKKSGATCTAKAVYYKSCECGACDKSEGAATFETGTMDLHSFGSSLKQDPTCEEAGWGDYRHCSVCDKDYYEDVKDSGKWIEISDLETWKTSGSGYIEPKGHNPSETSEVPATCVATGTKAYWYCDRCETYYSDSACSAVIGNDDDLNSWLNDAGRLAIDPAAHDFDESTWATENGSTTHWHPCKNKGCEAKGSESAHNYTVLVSKDADGHIYKCAQCDAQNIKENHNKNGNNGKLVNNDPSGHWYVCSCGYGPVDKDNHVFNENDCTKQGTCECGYVREPGEHVKKPGYSEVVFDATCEAKGKTKYQCEHCNEYFELEDIPALEHSYEGATPNYDWAEDYSTCTATVKCQREGCNHTETEIASESNVVYTKETDKTCKEKETGHYTATFTKGVFTTQQTTAVEVGGYAEHSTNRTNAVAATCTDAGLEAYWQCSVCDKYFEDDNGSVGSEIEDFATWSADGGNGYIAPTAHKGTNSHTDKLDSTCTVPGHEEYWYCSACRKYFSNSGLTTVIGDASALETWKTTGNGFVPAKGHVAHPTHTNAVAETCTTSGVKEYWYCSQCEKYYSDEACTTLIGDASALETWKTTGNGFVPAKGHASPAAHTNAVAETCTTSGVKEYWYCSQCQTYFSDSGLTTVIGDASALETWKTTGNGFVPAKGHVAHPTHTNAVAATCTKYGVKEYWYCSQCQTYFSDSTCQNAIGDATVLAGWKEDPTGGRVDMIDHTYDRQVLDPKYLVHAANCTEPATYYKSCACGVASKTLTFTYGSALGHDGEAHSLAATCTEPGYKTYYTCERDGCTFKGKYYSDSACTVEIASLETWKAVGGAGYIAALGHQMVVDETSSTAATCDTPGTIIEKCTRPGCTYTTSGRTIAAHHTYGADGVCTVAGCGATLEPAEVEAVETAVGKVESGTGENTATVNTPAMDILNAVAGNDMPADIVKQLAEGATLDVEFKVAAETAPEKIEKAKNIAKNAIGEVTKESEGSEAKISAPIEIDLKMLLSGTAGKTPIHNLNKPIEIAVPVPADIAAATQAVSGKVIEYFVLRIHVNADDSKQVDILPATVDANGNFIFETDKLSTFVPMVVISDPEPEERPHSHGDTIVIGKRDNKEETKEVEENPNTGAPVPSFGIALVVLGAACVVASKKRK